MCETKMKCQTCKLEKDTLYEWCGYKNCRSCCKEYYRDNDLDDEQSFEDFLLQMKIIKEEEK